MSDGKSSERALELIESATDLLKTIRRLDRANLIGSQYSTDPKDTIKLRPIQLRRLAKALQSVGRKR